MSSAPSSLAPRNRQERRHPDRLHVAEAAEYLGMSRRYVYRLLSGRQIPYVKLSNVVLIERRDLDALLERNRVEAVR